MKPKSESLSSNEILQCYSNDHSFDLPEAVASAIETDYGPTAEQVRALVLAAKALVKTTINVNDGFVALDRSRLESTLAPFSHIKEEA